ncbi:MAG: hypothetical protein ACR2QB_07425 [Gammaproteobacteria bacterium]
MKTITGILLCLTGVAAQAANVHVVASGTFSQVTGDADKLPFAIPAPGTVFTLTFSYDDSAVDITGPTTPEVGIYRTAISTMSLSIGGDLYSAISPNSIILLDNALNDQDPGNTADNWFASSDVFVSGDGTEEHDIAMTLFNLAPIAESPIPPMSTTELVEPFLSPDWSIAAIRYRVKELTELESGQVTAELVAAAEANIESLVVTTVPVPGAVWLFGSALLLLGRCRRRSRAL